jgi:hypothetical protein
MECWSIGSALTQLIQGVVSKEGVERGMPMFRVSVIPGLLLLKRTRNPEILEWLFPVLHYSNTPLLHAALPSALMRGY